MYGKILVEITVLTVVDDGGVLYLNAALTFVPYSKDVLLCLKPPSLFRVILVSVLYICLVLNWENMELPSDAQTIQTEPV